MPKRSKSLGKQNSASQSTSNKLLKQVVESLHQQQNSAAPSRPDVATIEKPMRDRIYRFTQSFIAANVTTSSTIETDSSYVFSLSQLPNATSLAAVFDRYRIIQCKLAFFPYATEAVLTSGTTAGPCYTVLDYDDANSTTIANLLSYDNLKIAPIGTYFERVLTPRAAVAAFSGSVFTSFAQAPSRQWMDVASPNIQYYGVKVGLPVGSVSGTILWNTVCTMEIEFSHPR
jgi:hypothetical protein